MLNTENKDMQDLLTPRIKRALPDSSTSSGVLAQTVASRVTDDLAGRVEKVKEITGLDNSDLIRIGLIRVVEEVENTGSLRIGKKKAKPLAIPK